MGTSCYLQISNKDTFSKFVLKAYLALYGPTPAKIIQNMLLIMLNYPNYATKVHFGSMVWAIYDLFACRNIFVTTTNYMQWYIRSNLQQAVGKQPGLGYKSSLHNLKYFP